MLIPSTDAGLRGRGGGLPVGSDRDLPIPGFGQVVPPSGGLSRRTDGLIEADASSRGGGGGGGVDDAATLDFALSPLLILCFPQFAFSSLATGERWL